MLGGMGLENVLVQHNKAGNCPTSVPHCLTTLFNYTNYTWPGNYIWCGWRLHWNHEVWVTGIYWPATAALASINSLTYKTSRRQYWVHDWVRSREYQTSRLVGRLVGPQWGGSVICLLSKWWQAVLVVLHLLTDFLWRRRRRSRFLRCVARLWVS